MTMHVWKTIKNVDLCYESSYCKSNNQHKLIWIPFWTMGKCEIQSLMRWTHVLPTQYEIEFQPYASTLQWVSAIDSIFRFVFQQLHSMYITY